MKEGEKTVFTCSWKNYVNIHGILFSCSLCVILWQAVDANTPKPWGCPQLIGAIEARLEGLRARLAQAVAKLIWGVLQGSGQVTVVPGHCDNLGLYRQNICIWMQPATLQGLFFRFPGGWSSSSGTHGVCGSSPGLGSRSWGGCLCTWASLHLGRGSGWALAFTERSLMSCWSQGCPCCWAGETAPALVSGGLQLVLRRSWRSLSTTSIPSAHTVLSSFSFLPLRSLYSLSCPICASPSQNVVEKRWLKEHMNKYTRGKMCSSSKMVQIILNKNDFLLMLKEKIQCLTS